MNRLQPNASTPPPVLLLVGHGAKHALGTQQFHQAAREVAGILPDRTVESCFLEHAQPSFPEVIERIAAGTARTVTVCPVLLFAAGHAKQDVPALIQEARSRFPRLTFRQADVLNDHPRLVELSALRRREAMDNVSSVPNDASIPRGSTVRVLIGRGSREPDAFENLSRFASADLPRATDLNDTGDSSRKADWNDAGDSRGEGDALEVGFIAMARPTLSEALRAAANSHHDRVIVQPHFLFSGALSDRLRDEVLEFSRTRDDQEWILADVLGPHPLLAEAIRDRALEAEAPTPAE
ncbi:MAG: sirohydrochlorin chelatase [Planctomycetales bacterium]